MNVCIGCLLQRKAVLIPMAMFGLVDSLQSCPSFHMLSELVYCLSDSSTFASGRDADSHSHLQAWAASSLVHHSIKLHMSEDLCLLQQGVHPPPLACPLSSRRSTINNSTPITPRDPMPIHPTAMGVMIGLGDPPPTTTSDHKAPSPPPLRSQPTLPGLDPWGWTACQQASWPTCLASLLGRWTGSKAPA